MIREFLFELLVGLRKTELTQEELEDMQEREKVIIGDNTEDDYLEYVERKNNNNEKQGEK